MNTASYDAKRTAPLIVDPYNDFLSEGGKIWPRVKEVAEQVGLLDKLRAGDYECWFHPNPTQRPTHAHAILKTVELLAALPAEN